MFPKVSLFLEDISNSINYSIDNKENVIIEGDTRNFSITYIMEYIHLLLQKM